MPVAPWYSLGDGNADKEAEKLIPSPNFYVHSVLFCSKVQKIWEKVYIQSFGYVISSHRHIRMAGVLGKR